MRDFFESLAREAGQRLLAESAQVADLAVEFKNDKDLVTAADRRMEDFIVAAIRKRFPGHAILGEETGFTRGTGDYCWVIDPIDGTTSFVHDQPFFSVSIALQKNGESILGAVVAPRLGELFLAEKGAGATLNSRPIRVSRRDQLIHSVLATGFACIRAGWPDNNLPLFCRVMPRIRGVRRYGSAAIDLSYVACGRLEGFWELNLKPYDIGAGVLMVREAGGTVTDLRGGADFPAAGTLATNGLIAREFLDLAGILFQ